tara:strand:+ start:21987 stop:22706 length:720 start_codon:yes stop_codon:yes gene_type:complete
MRLIARLDIKNNYVIKGINYEGLRKIGNPNEISKQYYNDGADEIILIDSVASLYDRSNIFKIANAASKDIFIPITVGGGLRNLNDIKKALDNGADKVAINSSVVKRPEFMLEAVKEYGASTILSSIEVKKINKKFLVYFNNGKENSNIDLLYWLELVQKYGCGEILLSSIDNDGTEKGCNYELLNTVRKYISVPIIYSGGCKDLNDIKKFKKFHSNDALAIGSIIHYKKTNFKIIKQKI